MLGRVKFTYDWKLDCTKLDEESPPFKCSFQNVGYSFRLWKSNFAGDPDTKSVFLKYMNGPRKDISIPFSLELINHAVNATSCKLCLNHTSDHTFPRDGEDGVQWCTNRFFRIQHGKDINVQSYDFTVRCTIFIKVADFSINTTPPVLDSLLPSSLLKMFESTLPNEKEASGGENDNYSDVVLTSNDQQCFRCHKIVLSVVSEVFKSMFKEGFEDNEMKMETMNSVVLKEVVRFMYTSQVEEENVKDILLNLVKAAEKYKLKTLTEYCEWLMFKELKKENVLDFLIVADEFNFVDVKEKAVSLINNRWFEFYDEEEFNTFKKLYPNLIYDIWHDASCKLHVSVELVS